MKEANEVWQGKIVEIIREEFPDAEINYTSPEVSYFFLRLAGSGHTLDSELLEKARAVLSPSGLLENNLTRERLKMPQIKTLTPFFETFGLVQFILS